MLKGQEAPPPLPPEKYLIKLLFSVKHKLLWDKNVSSTVSCGSTMIEYLLFGSLIAVVCAVTIGSIGANANETFGTINNAIGSKTDPDPPVPPGPDPSVPAYAMLYDDGSFVFQRGNVPESGKTLVKSYTDFETKEMISVNSAPWYSERLSVKTVTFKDKISPINTYGLFREMRNCTTMNLEKLDTTNVTNMSYMFSYCTSLTSLDLSNFNTSNATDMSGMFCYCRSLTSLDLSNFDTSNVTDMNDMFGDCFSSLISLNVTSFDTSKVTNMSSMFQNCDTLTSLDVTNFDTSKVTNMNEMFTNCSKLVSLDVTNFDTTKVTNMGNMFSACHSFVSLDVTNFNTTKVTNMNGMFNNCRSLTSINLPLNIASSPAVITGANRLIADGIPYMFKDDQKLKDAGQIPSWYVGTYAIV